MELIDIIPAKNTLGECPLWDAATQSLWWTDIQERHLHRYRPATRAIETFVPPERLTSFGFVKGSNKLIAAFESGLGLYEPGGAVEWLLQPIFETPGLRFNDGRVDRQGRFWCGTMVEGDGGEPAGALYRLDPDGASSIHARGISISNGICWSPDGTKFYFADSPTRTIFVYDTDNGNIANRRVFAHTPEGEYPDGANVDSEGFVWSALWGGGRVVRFSPDGAVDRELKVPATQPSCIAFGGARLDLLFVTSARDGLNAEALVGQPQAGDIFVFQSPVPGLLDDRFGHDKISTQPAAP
ncbi:MAG TPA: SMP-30/gluconolactonase/LRE family protein [Rhizomicrobium sp.]|jgi:sugar lactone lactonase YvrE